jgi:2-dehydro-3-deoxygluconokinase
MAPPELVTIGELLLSLRPPLGYRLERTPVLEVSVAGSELNVVVALSRLGVKCALISKVNDDAIGRTAVDEVRSFGIETSAIVSIAGYRNGIMFQEIGTQPRLNYVIYDRENTAFCSLKSTEVDWSVFDRARGLFLTGVTVALGSRVEETVRAALDRARRADIEVILDLNYRTGLWSPSRARTVCSEILRSTDVLLAGPEEIRVVLGLDGCHEAVAKELAETYDLRVVVITDGPKGALAYDGRTYQVPAFPTKIINRFGIGDAFAAGFIYGSWKSGTEEGLRVGAAIAALKGTVLSPNFPIVTQQEIDDLIAKAGNGAPGSSPNDVTR